MYQTIKEPAPGLLSLSHASNLKKESMIGTIPGLAILLIIYKAVMFWMRYELTSLQDHNKELLRSLKEDDQQESDPD